MADESNLGFDIAKMVEDLSVDEGGSDPEGKSEAKKVSKLLVKLAPHYNSIDGVANTLAKEFAQKQKSDAVQTGLYVLTRMVILETAQLVGIGGGLAKLDLMSLNVAKLKAKVEEINKKLDIILDAPLAQAVEFLEMALIHLEAGNIANTIEELKNVKLHAMKAFQYAGGKVPEDEILRCKVLAKQLKIFSEILIQSYDGTKITPFPFLENLTKETIRKLIEIDVTAVQSYHDSKRISSFTWNKALKVKQKRDLLDSLLQTAYPYISEGRGLTSTLAPLEVPYHLKLLPQFLPEGEEDSASLIIGQHEGRPFTTRVWREGKVAFCSFGNPPISAEITQGEEVTIQITDVLLSSAQPEFKHGDYTFKDCLLLHCLLVTGKGEEVLGRRQELTMSVLSHTCQYEIKGSSSTQLTALHLAAQFSSGSVVRSLIEAGADVGAQDDPDQKSPLHYAASDNQTVVPVLLRERAEVNLLDNEERSPLFNAAHANHREAVIALCAGGADPYLGKSPLTDSLVTEEMTTLIREQLSL